MITRDGILRKKQMDKICPLLNSILLGKGKDVVVHFPLLRGSFDIYSANCSSGME
jgi:hypothetical protein